MYVRVLHCKLHIQYHTSVSVRLVGHKKWKGEVVTSRCHGSKISWLQNFLVTRFMEEMSSVFLFILLFHCHSFPHWWPPAFLIYPPPPPRRYKIVILFFQQKMSPLFFIVRSSSLSLFFSLSFADLSPTFSFSALSFYFSIFQICGHDN